MIVNGKEYEIGDLIKNIDRDEFKKRVYRIISLKTTIIGEVQRVMM